MYVCLRDVVVHTVLSRPSVDEAFQSHLLAYAGAFHIEMDAIEQRLGSLDRTTCFRCNSLCDPETLIGDIQSDEQRRLLVPFRALLAAISGYTDFAIDKVGKRLVGSYPLVSEAFAPSPRGRPGQRVLGKLLGIELDQATIDRGTLCDRRARASGREGLAGSGRAFGFADAGRGGRPGLWLARTSFRSALTVSLAFCGLGRRGPRRRTGHHAGRVPRRRSRSPAQKRGPSKPIPPMVTNPVERAMGTGRPASRHGPGQLEAAFEAGERAASGERRHVTLHHRVEGQLAEPAQAMRQR